MIKTASVVRVEARPGMEAAVAKLLRDMFPLARQEPALAAWFALRTGPSSFAIFDAFAGDESRQAEFNARIAAVLGAKAGKLFLQPPAIETAEVIAAKTTETRERGPTILRPRPRPRKRRHDPGNVCIFHL